MSSRVAQIDEKFPPVICTSLNRTGMDLVVG